MKQAIMKSRWMYAVLFIVVALVMLAYEVVKEAIFKGALSPWQSHTITILVTSSLATFAAVIIRSWSESILKKEQIIQLQQQNIELHEKNIHTFHLALKAVHHIVDDFVVHYRFIMRDVKDDGSISREAVEVLDSSVQQVVRQLKILEGLKEPDREESYRDFYPGR